MIAELQGRNDGSLGSSQSVVRSELGVAPRDDDEEGEGEGEEWRRRYPSLRYEMVLTSRRPEIAECGGGGRRTDDSLWLQQNCCYRPKGKRRKGEEMK